MAIDRLPNPSVAPGYTPGVDGVAAGEHSKKGAPRQVEASIPSDTSKTVQSKPPLPVPVKGLAGVSLETLVDSISEKERRQGIKGSIDQVKSSSKNRMELLEKRVKELEKAAKKSKVSGWLKALKWIGIILGAVVAAAAVVATGGAASAVVMGVVAGIALCNEIASEASGGKVSLGAGLTALLKECGVPDKIANILGPVLVGVAMLAASIGAGAAGVIASRAASTAATVGANAAKVASQTAATASKVASTASRVASVLKRAMVALHNASKWTNLAQGAVSVSSGSLGIADSVQKYEAALAQIKTIKIDALLEKLRAMDEQELDHINKMMDVLNDTLKSVKQIVDKGNESMATIVGGTPAMA
ncbi:type III secretion system translocon subunit SctE [Halodesulfovibrio marinisediminis]|uniref:Secretion system effector C (SseC) like family protein n=1 Tax=Halodesulfovibrio marinisediminis DSM 17456 TaxID=1121457 RepID=A0A1N6I9A1_9BACT|nr:type III secretion system translocon subunit SctE [Halodesulfovibrio marinisediminis]SIO28597.1 Secretion system effector C (SseC) like family protein [Halodesulfovibrio marinisediminis DSM 17456]